MSDFEWQQAFEYIKPYVVKVSTPHGFGTGFLVGQARTRQLCGIATAAHVVNLSHFLGQQIRIDHFHSGKSVILAPPDRAVLIEESQDTAAVVFNKGDIPFPDVDLNLISEDHFLKVGVEAGWMGFPQISARNLCFFAGRVSCRAQQDKAYLIDGVVINGVSGGPTFYLDADRATIIGVVSAYIPSQTTGGSLDLPPFTGQAIVRVSRA